MIAQDEAATGALIAHIETSARQLQKASTSVPSRNLILATNILRKISKSSAARNELANQVGAFTNEKNNIFSGLLLLLETLSKQPPAQSDLFITTASAMVELCKHENISSKVAAKKKWVDTLVNIAKTERARDGERKGQRGGGSGASRIKVEKMDILVGLVLGEGEL